MGARVTIAEVARKLGVKPPTVYGWQRMAGFPARDGDGRVDLDQVLAWFTARGGARGRGRPVEAERLNADAARATPAPAVPPSVPRIEAPSPQPSVLDGVPPADAEVLEALVEGNTDRLKGMAMGGRLTPGLLKLGAAIGRSRRELGEAQRREIENRARQGQLLEAEEVKRAWTMQIELVKGHFQALPGKLAPQLVEKPYEAIYQTIEEELRALLEAFASGGPST